MAGALQPRPFGVWPLTTSFDLPPARRATWGEVRDSETTAEGPPHVRGDDGAEVGARVTAAAKRREPRRGWRARGATRRPKEPRATSLQGASSKFLPAALGAT